jgi:hypothetical protein
MSEFIIALSSVFTAGATVVLAVLSFGTWRLYQLERRRQNERSKLVAVYCLSAHSELQNLLPALGKALEDTDIAGVFLSVATRSAAEVLPGALERVRAALREATALDNADLLTVIYFAELHLLVAERALSILMHEVRGSRTDKRPFGDAIHYNIKAAADYLSTACRRLPEVAGTKGEQEELDRLLERVKKMAEASSNPPTVRAKC